MSAQAFYSKIAPLYDAGLWLNGYKRAARYVVAQLPFGKDESFAVLDAGCGTGLYSIAVLKRFPKARVLAVDFNAAMARQMAASVKRHGFAHRAEVRVGDALGEVTDKEEWFDLIVTGGLLEYIPLQPAVRNLARYLRTGGYFLNSPVRDNIWGALVGKWAKFEPYPAQQNLSVFTENGFALLKTLPLPPRYFPISLVKEAHLFRKKSPPGRR